MSYVEYDSNNSGGRWWLTDEDWRALERAGWIVRWSTLGFKYTPEDDNCRTADGVPVLVPVEELPEDNWQRRGRGASPDGRWLGALATGAYKPGATNLRDAVEEWERVTGKSSTDAGCPCCGQPHNFTLYGTNGEHIKSGPSVSYEASWGDE